ncbi:MAG: hypothetical protein PVI97_00695 [Candidatus Thiodiazotropha sp.]|jgi:hypothetical protein
MNQPAEQLEPRVIWIDHQNVDLAWEAALPMLELAFDYQSNHTPESVLQDLQSNKALLWMSVLPDQILAAGVTWIDAYANGRVLNIAFGAGDMGELKRMLPYVIDYARFAECVAIECHGRRGWVRELGKEGFDEISTTVRLEL